jgi:carbon monoxide dehydrogenase subunit G
VELKNRFEVPVPPGEAWEVLTDLERIAPCLPGAQLKEVEGDEYRGLVKVKVGPITAQYQGAARFLERDAASRRAVLRAEGRETRGQGNAAATITATLEPAGSGTVVEVVTDLSVTGKVAQFGRGVLAEVSAKLLDQFVKNLETSVLATSPSGGSHPGASPDGDRPVDAAGTSALAGEAPGEGTGANASSEGAGRAPGGARRVEGPEAAPVDLLDLAGDSLTRRLLPLAGVALLVALFWWAWRRSRR